MCTFSWHKYVVSLLGNISLEWRPRASRCYVFVWWTNIVFLPHHWTWLFNAHLNQTASHVYLLINCKHNGYIENLLWFMEFPNRPPALKNVFIITSLGCLAFTVQNDVCAEFAKKSVTRPQGCNSALFGMSRPFIAFNTTRWGWEFDTRWLFSHLSIEGDRFEFKCQSCNIAAGLEAKMTFTHVWIPTHNKHAFQHV